MGGCQRSGDEGGEVVRAEGAPGVRTLDRCHPRGKAGQKQEVQQQRAWSPEPAVTPWHEFCRVAL